jgi:hypothetical protein
VGVVACDRMEKRRWNVTLSLAPSRAAGDLVAAPLLLAAPLPAGGALGLREAVAWLPGHPQVGRRGPPLPSPVLPDCQWVLEEGGGPLLLAILMVPGLALLDLWWTDYAPGAISGNAA